MEFYLNRSTFALFIALLIHLVFILLFWLLGTITPEIKRPLEKEQKIKISLKELPKMYKKSGFDKKRPTIKKVVPPMPKGSQLNKMVTLKDVSKKPTLNKPKKPEPISKPKPKPKIEPLPPKKPFIPLVEKKDPMSWMFEDKSQQEKKQTKENSTTAGGSISQDIQKLYGEEFGKLSPGQQKYIIDNQEIMRRITQEVLTRVARVNLPRDLNVNKTNVVEFYLHPNGDMTDFKFLKKSGYYVLDDTTQETIEYSYSRYPHPKEKTLIRYNIYYNLARY